MKVKLVALGAAALAAAPSSAVAKFGAMSTSYSLCSAGTIMADGSYVRFGSVASNRHPLGTRIYLRNTSFLGRKRFTVRDRIGWGSDLDFWSPSCSYSWVWGRRYVTYSLGWPHRRGRVVGKKIRLGRLTHKAPR